MFFNCAQSVLDYLLNFATLVVAHFY